MRCLQHYAGILRGTSNRCKLLWCLEGDSSFVSFTRRRPDVVLILRRAVTTGSSWLYRRLWAEGANWPKQLAVIANKRATPAERETVVRAFFDAPLNTLDFYFGQRLRRRVQSMDDLQSPAWKHFLLHWAWLDPMSVAPIEFKHGRDARRSDAGMAWSRFAAAAMIEETALLHAAVTGTEDASPSPVQEGLAPPRRQRRLTVKDVFRFRFMEKLRTQGEKFNPATAEFSGRVKTAFDDLPRVEKEALEDEVRNIPEGMNWKAYKLHVLRVGGREAHTVDEASWLSHLPFKLSFTW